MRVASYNIGGRSQETVYSKRRSVVRRIVEAKPDAFGLQEVSRADAENLRVALGEHGYRQAGMRDVVPGQLNFYSVEAFESHVVGSIALSPGDCAESLRKPRRHILWSRLMRDDGTSLTICNVHLVGAGNKSDAAHHLLVNANLREAVVLGDFNTTPQERLYARITADGWRDAAISGLRADAGPTIHRHGKAKDRRVDWILVPALWSIEEYRVLRAASTKDEPSDHYMVTARLGHLGAAVPLAEANAGEIGRA